MSLPTGIARDDVLAALRDWDRGFSHDRRSVDPALRASGIVLVWPGQVDVLGDAALVTPAP